jgi:type II secretory pathway pseudopilin PulG
MTRRAPSMSAAARARGFSLLEAVLAMVLLGVAVSTVVGSMSAVQRMTHHDQERLNAAEVAHQLILQYLHDPKQMPDDDLPIEQGKGRYRYLLSEEILVQEQEADRVQTRRARSMSSLSTNERLGAGLVLITVKVFPDTDAPLSRTSELITLNRIFDPYASTDDQTLLKHVEKLLGRDLNLPVQAPPQ